MRNAPLDDWLLASFSPLVTAQAVAHTRQKGNVQ
jgi:hypothetical protein